MKAVVCSIPSVSSGVLFVLCLTVLFIPPVFGDSCEILSTRFFQRSQNVIDTDWYSGIPYRRYRTEVYSCAEITYRSTYWASAYSTDVEVMATFADQSTQTRRLGCEKRRLDFGDVASCSLCFESENAITKIECSFR